MNQKNEGRWEYQFKDEADCLVLVVYLGKGVLTDEIKVEVHAHVVRLLIKVTCTAHLTYVMQTQADTFLKIM